MTVIIREIVKATCIYCRGILTDEEQNLSAHKYCADLMATAGSSNSISVIEKFFANLINYDYGPDTILQAEYIQIHDAVYKIPIEFNQIAFTKLILNYQSNEKPEGLINHPTLTKLILRHVQSYSTSKWVSELTHLEELAIIIRKRFDYDKLFSKLNELQNLQGFTFRAETIGTVGSFVRLNRYPPQIQHMSSLRELNISNAQLMKIPDDTVFPSNLERLTLENNNIANIGGIKNVLPQLKDFKVSNNKFISAEFLKYGLDLENFDLGYNNISKLPTQLPNLENLSKVDLRNNLLSEIPISINSWSELFILNLTDNKLRQNPNLAELEKLRILNLKSNQIKNITDCIPSVTVLDVEDNLITKIPKFLTNSRIRNLNLSNNKIRRIPDYIEDFGVYPRIILEGNPLDNHSKQMIADLNNQGYKIQF